MSIGNLGESPVSLETDGQAAFSSEEYQMSSLELAAHDSVGGSDEQSLDGNSLLD